MSSEVSLSGAPRDSAEQQAEARRAGLLGFASVAVSIAGIACIRSGSGTRVTEPGAKVAQSDVDRQRDLLDLAANTGLQGAGTVLKAAGLLATIPLVLFLLRLVVRRGGAPSPWIVRALYGGSVLVAGAIIARYAALRDIADTYTSSGAQSAQRAGDLIDGSDTFTAAVVFELAARVVFAVWVGLLSSAMMRVGLLTSFLGYWGIAAAGAFVVLPIGDAMFLSWFVSVALLAYGYWPGGRPEAWERRAAVDGPALD